MKDELVTVIVPVYNCEKHIENCVNNLLCQSYNNIEIILVNDGSNDNSEHICLKLVEESENVKYYYQSNSGVSVARNTGLEHAQGDLIMFVDADDSVHVDIVKNLVAEMNDEIDMVCCSYELLHNLKKEYMFEEDFFAKTNEQKEPIYLQLFDYTYGHSSSNVTAIGVPWAKLFRQSMIEKYNLRFDSKLKRMQDNVFVMNAVYYARGIRYINKCLYKYRVDHINSYKSGVYSPNVYLEVLNSRHEFFDEHPEIMTSIIKQYYFKEHVNDLMMSIHYLVDNGKTVSSTVKAIKSLCENPLYVETLQYNEKSVLSEKQRIQCFLYRHKMYISLMILYKIIYFLKGRKR